MHLEYWKEEFGQWFTMGYYNTYCEADNMGQSMIVHGLTCCYRIT